MCTHDVSVLYSTSDVNYVGGTVNLGERPKQNLKLLPPPIFSLLHAPPSALGCHKPCRQHHPPTPTHTDTQSVTAFILWDALDFLCFTLRSSLPSPFYGVSRADLSQGASHQFVSFQISIPLSLINLVVTFSIWEFSFVPPICLVIFDSILFLHHTLNIFFHFKNILRNLYSYLVCPHHQCFMGLIL